LPFFEVELLGIEPVSPYQLVLARAAPDSLGTAADWGARPERTEQCQAPRLGYAVHVGASGSERTFTLPKLVNNLRGVIHRARRLVHNLSPGALAGCELALSAHVLVE